jgi:uncharacterized protein (DUF433 family)
MPATRNLRPTETAHIFLDDQGRASIDDTGFRVSMVVRDSAGGYSPAEIVEAYPGVLTLAQVFAALSYYHDHKAAVDDEIADEDRYVAEAREKAEQDPAYQAWKQKLLRKREELERGGPVG